MSLMSVSIITHLLSFIFTTFLVVLVLNMFHEGDYIHFIKIIMVSTIMLIIYPLIKSMPVDLQFMMNSFITWTALIKITSSEVLLWHAIVTALVATVFTNALLPWVLQII